MYIFIFLLLACVIICALFYCLSYVLEFVSNLVTFLLLTFIAFIFNLAVGIFRFVARGYDLLFDSVERLIRKLWSCVAKWVLYLKHITLDNPRIRRIANALWLKSIDFLKKWLGRLLARSFDVMSVFSRKSLVLAKTCTRSHPWLTLFSTLFLFLGLVFAFVPASEEEFFSPDAFENESELNAVMARLISEAGDGSSSAAQEINRLTTDLIRGDKVRTAYQVELRDYLRFNPEKVESALLEVDKICLSANDRDVKLASKSQRQLRKIYGNPVRVAIIKLKYPDAFDFLEQPIAEKIAVQIKYLGKKHNSSSVAKLVKIVDNISLWEVYQKEMDKYLKTEEGRKLASFFKSIEDNSKKLEKFEKDPIFVYFKTQTTMSNKDSN